MNNTIGKVPERLLRSVAKAKARRTQSTSAAHTFFVVFVGRRSFSIVWRKFTRCCLSVPISFSIKRQVRNKIVVCHDRISRLSFLKHRNVFVEVNHMLRLQLLHWVPVVLVSEWFRGISVCYKIQNTHFSIKQKFSSMSILISDLKVSLLRVNFRFYDLLHSVSSLFDFLCFYNFFTTSMKNWHRNSNSFCSIWYLLETHRAPLVKTNLVLNFNKKIQVKSLLLVYV